MGIGYNIKVIGGEINSWLIMFDEKFKGRIVLLDDMCSSFVIVLIFFGYNLNIINFKEIV